MTYEGFAAAWPSRDGEFADKFNSMPKYVVSSTLENPEWNNTTVLEGDLAQAVARLKEELAGDIAMQQDPAGGGAPLTAIGKTGGDRGANGFADIGIIHYDQRVLSAQL